MLAALNVKINPVSQWNLFSRACRSDHNTTFILESWNMDDRGHRWIQMTIQKQSTYSTQVTLLKTNYKTPCTAEAGGKPHISDAAGYQYDQVYASQNGSEQENKGTGDYLSRCWREQLRWLQTATHNKLVIQIHAWCYLWEELLLKHHYPCITHDIVKKNNFQVK